jgi:SAM-dependent methyltransferase
MLDLKIDAMGIDLVPCDPLVQEGDIHDLVFDDNSFDFVFTNIIDHTINPQQMINEIERVLKPGGHFFLQMQAGLNQDEFTEYKPETTSEIIDFFNYSECIHSDWLGEKPELINAHGMNFEMVFRKNKN